MDVCSAYYYHVGPNFKRVVNIKTVCPMAFKLYILKRHYSINMCTQFHSSILVKSGYHFGTFRYIASQIMALCEHTRPMAFRLLNQIKNT